MLPFWLNVAGLLQGIAGVIILFFFGWPQALFPPTGRRLIAADGPPDPELVRAERRQRWAALIGLLLVLSGMAFQLVAVIAQGFNFNDSMGRTLKPSQPSQPSSS